MVFAVLVKLGSKLELHTRRTFILPTKNSLELLHMDLMGPMRHESLGGKKYILVCGDDYSRFTWVAFLRENFETFENSNQCI